jgi:hypothetical protein
MKYIIAFIACILLFAECHKVKMYQFSSRIDTLGTKWGMVEGGHITYYFQNPDSWSDAVTGYVSEHENAYETIDTVFKAQLPRKLRFFIWTDTAMARQQLGYPLGFAVPTECVCHVRPNQTVGHEMTHILCYWSWGITPTEITRFVNEGIAVAFDLNPGSKIDVAKSAIAGQNIQSILDLWSGGNYASESVLYPVAGAFMQYMYNQNQSDKFDSLTKHQTIADAQSIYGNSQFDQLIANFNKLLGL